MSRDMNLLTVTRYADLGMITRDWEAMMFKLVSILRDVRGATAIEYGLIAALIAVAAITAMSSLGRKVGTTFNNVATNMKAT